MRITEPKVNPVIEIHNTLEHGYPHCHVGVQKVKVYVFSDGIVPEEALSKKDLKFIYGYYNKMIQIFNDMAWTVVPCPAEYLGNLYNGKNT